MSDLLKDPIDFGSQLAEGERRYNELEIRRKVAPKQVKVKKGNKWVWPKPDCQDCGDPIGEERLEATGSDICIDCAEARERSQKRR